MHPRTLATTVLFFLLPLVGCRSTVPIHAWTPPRLQSAVGRSVALATIVGNPSRATELERAIAANRPPELSRSVALVGQAELQSHSNIQLASAVQHVPSDLALLSAARKQGIDYVLLGEILQKRGVPRSSAGISREAGETGDAVGGGAASEREADRPLASPRRKAESLTVSWRLIDVGQSRVVGGVPVTVTAESIGQLHSGFDARAESTAAENVTDAMLVEAAARETWKLLVPYVRRGTVSLARPYVLPGSRDVRRGNELAEALRWSEAERVWQQVVERHPGNHAAWHNLALAAAARQDFERAKPLAQRALRMHPLGRYERTVVWIEGRQRELVDAFGLAAPDEGWLFSPD